MRSLTIAFVGLVVAAVVGSVYIGRFSAPATDIQSSPEFVAASGGANESDRIAIAGVEVSTDASAPAGLGEATSAAAGAVEASAALVTAGHFTRLDTIRSMSTAEFAPTMIDQTNSALTSFQFDVDTIDGFWIMERAVTAKAEQLSPGRVRVSMWCVAVVAAAEFGVGRESWETVTLEMVIVDGAWLVDGWMALPGPSPAPGAEMIFAGPLELGEVIGWAPAPSAYVGPEAP